MQILKMQHCKLIIFSNFYCIFSCCLNLFFMSNMLFCIYILFIMHVCILLYIHITVLYYILASFQKNKMLMLRLMLEYQHFEKYQTFSFPLQKAVHPLRRPLHWYINTPYCCGILQSCCVEFRNAAQHRILLRTEDKEGYCKEPVNFFIKMYTP